jgi:hypothetical protein
MTTKNKEKDPKQLAVSKLWEVDYEDISSKSYHHYGLEVFSCGIKEWAIGTDEECDIAVKEYIKDTLWAFNSDFIASACDLHEFADGLKPMQEKLCEGANSAILALVEKTCGLDEFAEQAVSADGRGHFLSAYDGEEQESFCGNYFIYRIS